MISNFSIRSAQLTDMADVFEIANDDVVRLNSFNTNKIQWAEHQEWFTRMLSSDSCVFYCVTTNDGFLAGVVYFNLNDQNEWYISIRLNKAYRGIGLGSWAIKTCSDMLKIAKYS